MPEARSRTGKKCTTRRTREGELLFSVQKNYRTKDPYHTATEMASFCRSCRSMCDATLRYAPPARQILGPEGPPVNPRCSTLPSFKDSSPTMDRDSDLLRILLDRYTDESDDDVEMQLRRMHDLADGGLYCLADFSSCIACFRRAPQGVGTERLPLIGLCMALVARMIRAFSVGGERDDATVWAIAQGVIQNDWDLCLDWSTFLLDMTLHGQGLGVGMLEAIIHLISDFGQESVRLFPPLAALPSTGMLAFRLWLASREANCNRECSRLRRSASTGCEPPCPVIVFVGQCSARLEEGEPPFGLAFSTFPFPSFLSSDIIQRLSTLQSSVEKRLICPNTAVNTIRPLINILGAVLSNKQTEKQVVRSHIYLHLFSAFALLIPAIQRLRKYHDGCLSPSAGLAVFMLSNEVFEAICSGTRCVESLKDAVKGGLALILFAPFTHGPTTICTSPALKTIGIRNASLLLRHAPFRSLGLAVIDAMEPYLSQDDLQNDISSHSKMGKFFIESWEVFKCLHDCDWACLGTKSLNNPVASCICSNVQCNGSNRQTGALKRCSRCRSVIYCSKSCQKKDWQLHRFECRVLQGQTCIAAKGGEHLKAALHHEVGLGVYLIAICRELFGAHLDWNRGSSAGIFTVSCADKVGGLKWSFITPREFLSKWVSRAENMRGWSRRRVDDELQALSRDAPNVMMAHGEFPCGRICISVLARFKRFAGRHWTKTFGLDGIGCRLKTAERMDLHLHSRQLAWLFWVGTLRLPQYLGPGKRLS
ncbi:hypothetical protein FA13DRAFT_1716754 [Coprinellus micaceus]|uniref:MYND-type domain-containing protein n=1 Tax=Coprinellus micaceus TaxID=71717 RepID=A0A4Y7SIA8_COPMI|nr:hypothetical protein FA13DRAFT_1716754 [Coprinellus micaceus]